VGRSPYPLYITRAVTRVVTRAITRAVTSLTWVVARVITWVGDLPWGLAWARMMFGSIEILLRSRLPQGDLEPWPYLLRGNQGGDRLLRGSGEPLACVCVYAMMCVWGNLCVCVERVCVLSAD
jgi:hypothetical protein